MVCNWILKRKWKAFRVWTVFALVYRKICTLSTAWLSVLLPPSSSSSSSPSSASSRHHMRIVCCVAYFACHITQYSSFWLVRHDSRWDVYSHFGNKIYCSRTMRRLWIHISFFFIDILYIYINFRYINLSSLPLFLSWRAMEIAAHSTGDELFSTTTPTHVPERVSLHNERQLLLTTTTTTT